MRKILTSHWLILAMAFAIRLYYGVIHHNPAEHLFSDMANYNRISDAILVNQWNNYHYFQPIGFPLIVSLMKFLTQYWGLALGLLHAIASTLSLWFMWEVCRKTIDAKWAKLTLLVGSLHLPWILYNGFLLSETLFTVVLAGLLWMSWKLYTAPTPQKAFLWGLFLIVGFLLKGTHVLLAPLTYLAWIWYEKKKAFKLYLFPAGLAILIGLSFNALITYRTIGHIQISASAGGLNLVEGKCPYKWNQDSTGITWLSPIYYQRRLDAVKQIWPEPFTNSNYFSQQGLKCIVDDPAVLLMSLEGIPLLFMGNHMFPASALSWARWVMLYEYLFVVFMLPGLVIYFARFFQLPQALKRQHLLIWVLPMASLFLCVYVFKSEIRFRIPFDVWFIPVAMMGWREIISKGNKNASDH